MAARIGAEARTATDRLAPRRRMGARPAGRSTAVRECFWSSVAAARLAVADAGAPSAEPFRSGVVIGNVYGALESIEAEQAVLERDGPGAVAAPLTAAACENAAPAMVR